MKLIHSTLLILGFYCIYIGLVTEFPYPYTYLPVAFGIGIVGSRLSSLFDDVNKIASKVN